MAHQEESMRKEAVSSQEPQRRVCGKIHLGELRKTSEYLLSLQLCGGGEAYE